MQKVNTNGKLWGSGAFFLPPQGMYYPVSIHAAISLQRMVLMINNQIYLGTTCPGYVNFDSWHFCVDIWVGEYVDRMQTLYFTRNHVTLFKMRLDF